MAQEQHKKNNNQKNKLFSMQMQNKNNVGCSSGERKQVSGFPLITNLI